MISLVWIPIENECSFLQYTYTSENEVCQKNSKLSEKQEYAKIRRFKKNAEHIFLSQECSFKNTIVLSSFYFNPLPNSSEQKYSRLKENI